jgi:hypothetical protein
MQMRLPHILSPAAKSPLAQAARLVTRQKEIVVMLQRLDPPDDDRIKGTSATEAPAPADVQPA